MNKKGFTLVELLAVITILAVTSMIVFPTIGSVISDAKESSYEEQILEIEKASEKWATDYVNLMDSYHLNIIYIELKSIQNSGYLEVDEIKNPLTNEKMEGCIQIKYDNDNKKYNYVYTELTCDSYATTSDSKNEYGYIIYNYDKTSKEFEISSSSKKYEPAGLSIYNYYVNNNLLKADGEVIDCTPSEENNYCEYSGSLFETEEEYVFRGSNPNNFVTLEGLDSNGNKKNTSWRILSIDKKDFSLKLISTSQVVNQWDTNAGIDFKSASSNVNILAEQEYGSSKIITSDYFIGNIVEINPSQTVSVIALKSSLKNIVGSFKTGLISVLDYVNASATISCQQNYLSDACKDNNYLFQSMFSKTSNSTWTLNSYQEGDIKEIWYINDSGILGHTTSENTKNIYPVIKLDSSVYITNANVAVGSSTSPYIIK